MAQRTWSLIVTLLGDRTRHDGSAVSGQDIAAALEPAGITPQAIRTALHRLRADGWIETTRDGRASLHRLSASALAQTRAAAPRIYGPAPAPGPLHLALTEAPPPGAATLAPGLHVARGPRPAATPGLTGTDLRLTPAQAASLWPRPLRRDAKALLARAAAPPDSPPETHRLLVLHDWRRLVLRAPDLPDALAPADWPGDALRRAVHALLAAP
ncbi:PaaX family transcriptional regulator [Jannaschia sp. Os4]|uniref:PaaX family transcriptional regulator C-terminal domain-containing protein n=1 Tax=Jannaschia sp. Os4 TaxID=2807617 RepID=UPI001939ABA2|nr:PaaX family transcriptional regulator C-terminal domain-containing protein [Jannaschia sp. Os4]MBM2577864.1 PaaX family transcriptional regulator [Jannaschia sp. Os4]